MKTLSIGKKKYKVGRSNRINKKFKIKIGKKTYHFGAKGYRIAPGTKKGYRYCARSSGIRSKSKKKITPNVLSRKIWGCKGKKSFKTK